MNNSKTIQAWHFSNGKLGYGDNRPITPGLSLACDPAKIRMCEYGFHASVNILSALRYAPSNTTTVSLVELGGRILEDTNKHCASIRRHLAVINCERILHEFAIWCAEQALALIDDPDRRSLEALAVKRRWLDGQATNEELAAARDAAMAAAGTTRVAWPAWTAAGSAAGAAAGAAWDASAAGADGDAQSIQLETMIRAGLAQEGAG